MSMKASLIRSFGGPDVFEYADVAVPEPGHGELLIQVAACGINPLKDIELVVFAGDPANKDGTVFVRGAFNQAKVDASHHAPFSGAAAVVICSTWRTTCKSSSKSQRWRRPCVGSEASMRSSR